MTEGDWETTGFAEGVIKGGIVGQSICEVSDWRKITISNLGRK